MNAVCPQCSGQIPTNEEGALISAMLCNNFAGKFEQESQWGYVYIDKKKIQIHHGIINIGPGRRYTLSNCSPTNCSPATPFILRSIRLITTELLPATTSITGHVFLCVWTWALIIVFGDVAQARHLGRHNRFAQQSNRVAARLVARSATRD